MNYVGILIGLATFLIIGLFHPLVIKGEYYFGTRCWWAFLVTGILCAGLSLYVENVYLSIIFGQPADIRLYLRWRWSSG